MIELLLEHAPVAAWLLVFAAGASIGSFLNVVIARLPAGESLVSPPSRCPKCGTAIAWHDNVPVLGWLWLRGKCRACGQPISARYPMVELLVGLLAIGVVRAFGPTWAALGYFAFVAALVALAYIDLDTWLLPHEITWPLLGVGLLSPLWNPAVTFFDAFVGAAIGIGCFGGVALFGEKVLKREVMGWGDVWLLGGIGAWLGWRAVLPVILLSSLQGLVVGAIMLAVKKRSAAGAPVPPTGADQPLPPADSALPPTESASLPLRSDALPSRSDALPSRSDVLPSRSDALPSRSDVLPSRSDVLPSRSDVLPSRSDALPSRSDVLPSRSDVLPTESVPPPTEATPPKGGPAPDKDDEDWVPPATAVPFGPFLALAAIEQVLLGAAIQALYNRITFGL